jgi:hypothetical protein
MALDRSPFVSELALDRASVRTVDSKSGHMHIATSPISKAGVRPYLGREIPKWPTLGLDPDRRYNLLLPADELTKGAATFTGKPLLIQHRPQMAADHDAEHVIGTVGSVSFGSPYLMAEDMVIWRDDGIQAVSSGTRQELSAGFFYDCDMTPGSHQGHAYDGVMRNISGNHVAIVPQGRAGHDVMVMDEQPQEFRAVKLSLMGAQVQGALSAYLPPLLAQDAQIDTAKLLTGVTAATWSKDKAKLAKALGKAAEGKMAQDASLDGLGALLDRLPVIAADADDDDDDKKPAMDSVHVITVAGGGAGGAGAVSKIAMDAAIASAVASTEAATVARMNAIRVAEREVAPIIGEVVVAMDSAAAVYKLALDHLNVDLTGVPEAAYGAVLKAIPKAAPAPTLAQDAAPANFADTWLAKGRVPLRQSA